MNDIQLINSKGDIISLQPRQADLKVFGSFTGVDCYDSVAPLTERDRMLLIEWLKGLVIDDAKNHQPE